MKSIYKLLIITAVLFITACGDDFLDQTTYQEVSSETAISTLTDADVALNGCYSAFQTTSLLGRNYIVVCDLATDNSKMRPENSGRFLNPYYWTITTSDGYSEGVWTYAYEALNRVNNILVKIDDLEGDDAERLRIKGEALGLRALGHLMLVNWFSQAYNEGSTGLGIPIATAPFEVDAEPARNTIAEVYTQILADLDAADNSLSYNANRYGYFTKAAAKVLKSRVYLYMNDWANAKAEAEAVINSGVYSLTDYTPTTDESTLLNYVQEWSADATSESIFSIINTSSDYMQTDALGYMYLYDGYGDVLPTTDLMSLYSATDSRNYWFQEDEDGYIHTNKYPGKGLTAGVDNHPVTRLSEAYLNAAEANYELGNEDIAISYLDEIRKRGDVYATTSTESGAALLNKILVERRKELCFEGHRFWDLKRRGLDIVRTDLTTPNAQALIEAGSNDYAYPIPLVEMNVNDNIAQNPGY